MGINNQNKIISAGKTTQGSQKSQNINPDDLLKQSVVNKKGQIGVIPTNGTTTIKETIPTKKEILDKLTKFQDLANKLLTPNINLKTAADLVKQMSNLNIEKDLEKIMKQPPPNTVLQEILIKLRMAASSVRNNEGNFIEGMIMNPKLGDPNLARLLGNADRQGQSLMAWGNTISQTITKNNTINIQHLHNIIFK